MKAAVDIGSNTVQMLAGIVQNGQVVPHYTFLATTRLGAFEAPGLLSQKSILATVAALQEIKALLEAAGVHEVYPVATSAVREAKNKAELLDRVKEACHWQIDVLSGDQEAALTFLGAQSLVQGEDCLMMDVGGGSSEIIVKKGMQLESVSIDIGAVRAKEESWDRQEIKARLQKESVLSIKGQAALKAVGIGGSFTSSAAVLLDLSEYSREAVHGLNCNYDQLEELWQKIHPLSDRERCAFSPLLAQRGEIIAQGLEIILSLMELFSIQEVLVSDAGILDGVLLKKD
ncbi:MAG: hypothetical protein ACOX7H_07705 [Bacillota bacterium]|jgi:exopolyphosphatase/guanosine-5'-triphosphate,3'-diphosphate pyrophosphatase